MSIDRHPELRELLDKTLRAVAQTNRTVIAELRDSTPDRSRMGSIISHFALGRLVQSFRSASYLVKKRYTFEATVVMRLIFEQLAWVMAIHDKHTKQEISIPPPKCIRAFNNKIEYAGRLYGQLSDVSHMNPKYVRGYLEFEAGEKEGRISVRPAKIAEAVQFALVLLVLAGLYGLIVEFLDSRKNGRHRFLESENGKLDLSARFRTRCVTLQTRLDKLNKYLANPPALTLINSRGDSA